VKGAVFIPCLQNSIPSALQFTYLTPRSKFPLKNSKNQGDENSFNFLNGFAHKKQYLLSKILTSIINVD